ncbi:MAG: DUF2207 domain-containing protein [Candidatus Liptonbacteria bacterium]|nr:DUF2207 domain-containing protein [Candidatus Liptonbacteria bacterium]
MTRSHRKIKKIFLLAGLFVFVISPVPLVTFAQSPQEVKSYQYDSISAVIKVNEDSTTNVEEKQTFNYLGEFHAGWRNIPLTKVDAITDISVIDGATGQPLKYSPSRLDKLEPSNWSKFTYFRERGDQNIEWYYNLKDTTHLWILKYKIHGSIEFNKDKDRLYWNIFSAYKVPVLFAQVSVSLPKKLEETDVTFDAYRNDKSVPITKNFDAQTGEFNFSSQNFPAGEAFTIDAKWPKGIVSQSAFWLDFFRIYYGLILSVLVALLGIGIGFAWWLKTEKFPKGRRTIVAEYEPPEHLKPAMAEIVTKEKLTNKNLTATIIDLAVRGYVKIEEDPSKDIGVKAWLGTIVPVLYLLFFASVFLTGIRIHGILGFLAPAIVVALLIGLIHRIKTQLKNYNILKNKDYYSDPALENYEKEYLQIILGSTDFFSTREMKKAGQSKQREFYHSTQKLKDSIYKETEVDTKAFDVGLTAEKKKNIIWIILFVLTFFLFGYGNSTLTTENQKWILLGSIIITSIALWAFIKYEARLSEHGRILKEEWLGFKLYLETAEKYRMQNLTPDLFEKYLPYAMIFGVEKKWAKNFEVMHLAPPNWYGSAAVYGSSGLGSGNGASSFSPTGFSSSFTSAFSSAFASSGASGGGGGGGGAGGGGGGGGGGAS